MTFFFDTAGVALSAMLCNDGVDVEDSQTEEQTQAEVQDVQEEQLGDGEPQSDSDGASSPAFSRWWLYGGVAAASILAALGVCALQRKKRRRGQQRGEPLRGAAGSSQAAKSTGRWAPSARACMHRTAGRGSGVSSGCRPCKFRQLPLPFDARARTAAGIAMHRRDGRSNVPTLHARCPSCWAAAACLAGAQAPP